MMMCHLRGAHKRLSVPPQTSDCPKSFLQHSQKKAARNLMVREWGEPPYRSPTLRPSDGTVQQRRSFRSIAEMDRRARCCS